MKMSTRFPNQQALVGPLGISCLRVDSLPGLFCGDAMAFKGWKLRGVSLKKRFESGYKVDPKTGCWLWQRHLGGPDGRGSLRVKGVITTAHRVAYELYKGKIPKGKCVLHTCDVPHCVNPNHLWIGTHKDNAKDCLNKSRRPQGEKCKHSKLTDKEVKQIRKLYPKMSGCKLGVMFGVSDQTIYDLILGRTWKHIN